MAAGALLFRNAVAVGVVCRRVATGLSQRAKRRDQLCVAIRNGLESEQRSEVNHSWATELESGGKTQLCQKSKDDHGDLHQSRSKLAAAGKRDESPKSDPAAAEANVICGGSSRRESKDRPSRRKEKRQPQRTNRARVRTRAHCSARKDGGDPRQPHAAIKGPFQPEQNHTPL
jgi:hypothetical protein